jgi:hypothetical protein
MIVPCALLTVAAARGGQSVHISRRIARIPASGGSPSYSASLQPLIRKYCVSCHSTAMHKAGLDLQHFAGPNDMRKDLKSWQGVIDHLTVGDMPPMGSPQPSASEKSRIVAWVQRFLSAEARATAGDPGDVPLRRFSNTEYNCTIRDLTGVDLQPAREFPADGAAGEGFTNAAESLSDVSPALLSKYFTAAKEIADHAVLLPDGFRFSAGKSRREWTDECTARLRAFYSDWTGPEGKLDFTPYLAETIKYRNELMTGNTTVEAVAEREKLNPKYLVLLWKTLTDANAGYPLTDIQNEWRMTDTPHVPKLVSEITAWQDKLWESARVGSYVRSMGKGFAESLTRQVPNSPEEVQQQTIRLSVKPAPGQSVVTLRLSSRMLTGSGNSDVSLRNLRLEAPGQPTLMLKDYANYGSAFETDFRKIFGQTSQYLKAAEEVVNDSHPSLDNTANEFGLSSELLRKWIETVSLQPYLKGAASEFPGRSVPVVSLELLGEQVRNSNNLPAINGWHGNGEDLPVLLTNSSSKLEHIPGNASPHSVLVHPNPSEFAAVVWTSPISGTVRVTAAINHAHPACGNGVAWWLEHRRAERAAMWDEGRIDLGGSASPPARSLLVHRGDQILLAVDAKDGDQSCDLTKVDLTIALTDGAAINFGKSWNLTADIADSVLAGNPHTDKYGNPGVWSFVKGPTRSVGSGTPSAIPRGSIVDSWRTAAADPARQAEAAKLADQIQELLCGSRPISEKDPNRALYDLLVSAATPLLRGVKGIGLPKLATGSDPFGAPLPANYTDVNHTILQIPNNISVTVRLPAALFAEREFVADGTIGSTHGGSCASLIGASVDENRITQLGDEATGVLSTPDHEAYRSLVSGLDRFRSCFPRFLCYPNVIPIDEVVNLKMFHREDEPLKRLFLTDEQAKNLDRLWEDHRFVSRQPAAENRYLPLFIGFVTQDQPKELVTFFEGQRPAFQKRADEFALFEESAIPRQIRQLADFTSRAYRRPLTAREQAEQIALYQSLRTKGAPHDEAMRGVLARVLVSPSFLFRIERPAAGPKPGPINDWELATRLSYFLWSSTPDDELRKLAQTGTLHEPAVLKAQTLRMLKSDRVRSLAIEFGTQWIHVRGFELLNEKNERLFPTYNESLRKAISEETVLFFQDLFQQNRPATSILNANYTYLNEELARYYSIPGVSGPQWRRVDNVQQFGRGGVLGLASVQASVSGASRTSPVLRGNWVVETLLGEKMPRPPPNVPKLPEEEGVENRTVKQEVEQHSKNPACASCHQRMDPFGFALEHYDAIGRFRLKDFGGLPIDDHARLTDGIEFAGIDGLRNYLLTKRKSQIIHLFCRRLLGYALGRSVQNSDQPLIDKMAVELNKNLGIDEAVEMIVNSPQFRMIRGVGH